MLGYQTRKRGNQDQGARGRNRRQGGDGPGRSSVRDARPTHPELGYPDNAGFLRQLPVGSVRAQVPLFDADGQMQRLAGIFRLTACYRGHQVG